MESLLIEPFEAEFMRSGAAAAMLVGLLCGVVGCFVLVRGMALMSDSLAHGVIPGIAAAILLTGGTVAAASQPEVLAGGLAGGLATAGATRLVHRSGRFREDTATAVVFVFMLALGVVLVSMLDSFSAGLTSFLFGDVLGIDPGQLPLTAGLTAALLAATALLYRPFMLISFDRRRAAALGVDVGRMELALTLFVAVAIVVGFRVVGALLVLGLLLAPPAAAALVTTRMPAMMAVSAGIAAASGPLGLLISWHLEVAAGATIVLVAVAAFLLLLLAQALPRRA